MTTCHSDIRDLVEAVVRKHFEQTNDASCDGAQMWNGQWWMPLTGCDTLQNMLDDLVYAVEKSVATTGVVPKKVTSTPVRDDAIYVAWQTRKALSYIPRAEGETIDSLADRILFDWLHANYPEVLKHLSQQGTADKAFRETVKRTEPGPTL